MAKIFRFDRSKGSDAKLSRIHARLPWNKRQPVRWGLALFAMLGTGAATQFVIWESQRLDERAALLSTITPGTVFEACYQVRALGLAPLHRGEPGYGAHLDADGDGIACEPYPGMPDWE